MSGRTLAGGVHVRWAIRADLPAMLAIEAASFEERWTAADFDTCFLNHSTVLLVAVRRGEVLGFTVYQLRDRRLELLNLAVRPDHRRTGVGGALVDRLLYKLSQHRRAKLALTVGEWNLTAQVFFRQMGFIATGIRRDYHPQGRGYRMEARA
jgi:ribosomal-protein-alanine N-acetyltransferase